MTDGVRLVESVFLPAGRPLRVIAAFLVAVRRFRVVAALRLATRRFRVTAAFRAAEVTIRQLLRRLTCGVWLTPRRSPVARSGRGQRPSACSAGLASLPPHSYRGNTMV